MQRCEEKRLTPDMHKTLKSTRFCCLWLAPFLYSQWHGCGQQNGSTRITAYFLQFSSTEQLPFCAIEQPSRFAPLYDLSGALNDTEWTLDYSSSDDSDGDVLGGGGGPAGGNVPDEALSRSSIQTSGQFMYTSDTPFGDAAMNSLIRQPDFTPLLSDVSIQAEAQVRSGNMLDVLCFFLGFIQCAQSGTNGAVRSRPCSINDKFYSLWPSLSESSSFSAGQCCKLPFMVNRYCYMVTYGTKSYR